MIWFKRTSSIVLSSSTCSCITVTPVEPGNWVEFTGAAAELMDAGGLTGVEVAVLVVVEVGVKVSVLVVVLVAVEVAVSVVVAVGEEVMVGVFEGVKEKIGVLVMVGVGVGKATVIMAPGTPAAGVEVTIMGFPELTPVPVTLLAVKVTA
jgi:hypothetical protein